MKFAHVNYWPNYIAGFEKKIADQAAAARQIGFDIDFIVLNHYRTGRSENLIHQKIESRFSKMSSFFPHRYIKKQVEFDKYNLVVLRYPMCTDFHCIPLSNKYGSKILSEHHTNELGELKSTHLTVSRYAKLALEYTLAGYYLRRTKGIIGVTPEIVEIERGKIGHNGPNLVLPNGISVGKVKKANRPVFDGQNLNLIFAASHFSPWQGLDRLLTGLSNYKGDTHISLKVIGEIPHEYNQTIKHIQQCENKTIQVYGAIKPEDIDPYYDNIHIALSCLNLERKNLKEASALKTRDALARGLPIVYGYKDTDLDGNEFFAKRIDSHTDHVDLNCIIEFAHQLNKTCDLQEKITEFARNNLDWTIKMKQLEQFLFSISTDHV